MDDAVRLLYEAAAAGNISSLQRSLREDSRILDKSCVSGCYTPLHVAAKLGHTGFVKEILNRNPFLAEMQDLEGMCPLHLAAANGHLEAAKALVSANPEVTLLKDKQGRNPLHVAAIGAGLEVIKELIVTGKPEAVFDRTARNETVLHLCVKHFRLEALTLLVESVDNVNLPEFMNLKDDDGFTVLHLAVAEKIVEIVRFLIQKTRVDLNISNSNGYTALDMVKSQSRRNTKDIDIIDILQFGGALSSRTSSRTLAHQPGDVNHTPNGQEVPHTQMDWLKKKRSTIMVVASLIASIAYQAGTTLSSSIWSEKITRQLWDEKNTSSNSNTSNPQRSNSSSTADAYPTDRLYYSEYATFMAMNTMGFLSSLCVILLLIGGLPIRHKFFMWILIVTMWIALSSMTLAYAFSMRILTNLDGFYVLHSSVGTVLLVWYGLILILLLTHVIRLIRRAISFASKKLRRSPPLRSAEGQPNLPRG